MAQHKTFKKIQTFVKEQIELPQNSVVITTIANGFKINNLTVLQQDFHWIVKNANGAKLGEFKNRRLAVLTAVLTVRKMFKFSHLVTTLDNQLSILKHDKNLFEEKISKDFKRELFEDRYSRTEFDLAK